MRVRSGRSEVERSLWVEALRFRESGMKTIEGKRGNETKTRTRQHGAKRVTRVEEGELSFVRENVAGDVNVNLEKG